MESLKNAINGLQADGMRWRDGKFAVNKELVQESTIVANVYHRMLSEGLPEDRIRVDSRGHDMTIYDDGGNLGLVAAFKRVTSGKAFRDYVQGTGLHKGKGFPKDIRVLGKVDAPNRVFVVFDPEGLLDKHSWKQSEVIWKTKLEQTCRKEGIEFCVIGTLRRQDT